MNKKITEIKKREERREVGMCKDFESLVKLAVKRGYKNPSYWARKVLSGRHQKV